MSEHRTTRVVVYVSPDEARALRSRAGGRRLSVYLRHLALGKRPGGAKHADDWWESLPPARREQVFEFLGDGRAPARPACPTGIEDPLPLG